MDKSVSHGNFRRFARKNNYSSNDVFKSPDETKYRNSLRMCNTPTATTDFTNFENKMLSPGYVKTTELMKNHEPRLPINIKKQSQQSNKEQSSNNISVR